MPAINPTGTAMSVVMVQFSPEPATNSDEVRRNIERIGSYVDRACNSFPGVDLIVFPEYSTHGFAFNPYATHLSLASTIPGPETELFGRKAREKGVWLCVSVVERADEPGANPYNSMVVIDAEGNVALKYRKMIPWCPKEPWTPGEEMNVCDGPKASKLAITICSDLDYPEVAREAAWKGANVILRPSKYMYPWDHIWDITNQVRAYENIAYVIATNHTGHDPSYTYFGRSMAVDFDGRILAQLGATEGMTKVDIFPALVEAARDERMSNNYLYQLKHRGFTGTPPLGRTGNPFSIYRDWDVIPERWNRPPNAACEQVASSSRAALQEQQPASPELVGSAHE
jgi:amidase